VALGSKEKISSTREEKSPLNDMEGFEILRKGEEKSPFKSIYQDPSPSINQR
jgi:hypothetical protein